MLWLQGILFIIILLICSDDDKETCAFKLKMPVLQLWLLQMIFENYK